jgi:hypothetical protein
VARVGRGAKSNKDATRFPNVVIVSRIETGSSKKNPIALPLHWICYSRTL